MEGALACIKLGIVFVNGKCIKLPIQTVQINDLVKLFSKKASYTKFVVKA